MLKALAIIFLLPIAFFSAVFIAVLLGFFSLMLFLALLAVAAALLVSRKIVA